MSSTARSGMSNSSSDTLNPDSSGSTGLTGAFVLDVGVVSHTLEGRVKKKKQEKQEKQKRT